MKRILFIAIAFCAITVQAQNVPVGNKMRPDLTLQSRAVVPDSSYTYAEGDTIVVPMKIRKYLTGERISLWVYNTTHIIKQVGGERFPNGILLEGINSWVPMSKNAPLLLPSPKKAATQKPAATQPQKPAEQPKPVAESQKPAEQQKPVEQAKPAEPQKPAEQTKPAEQPKPAEHAQPSPYEPARPVEYPSQQQPEQVMPVEPVKPEEPSQRVEHVHMHPHHRLSIGVRGGVASLMQQPVTWKIGYDALFDLQYGCYWRSNTAKPSLGFVIGLAAGFEHNDITMSNVTCKSDITADGLNLQYTASIDQIDEHTSQIQVEVPVLFSMVTPRGFYLNLGPKLILPVYGMYKQQLTNADIETYSPLLDVTFKNDVVLGQFTKAQLAGQSGKINTFLFKPTVAAMLDLGYEAKLNNGDAFSIGVYGDYGFSMKSTAKADLAPIVDIVPPSADANAQVRLGHLSSQVTKLGFFDAGLKLTYHFNLSK